MTTTATGQPSADPAQGTPNAGTGEPTKPDASAEAAKAQAAATTAGSPPPSEKPSEGKAAPPKEEGKTQPPAEYALKLAEDSFLDEEHDVQAVTEFAKAKGLDPETAQAVLDQRNDAVKAYAEANQAAVQKEVEGWKDLLAKDPDIGGEKLPAAAENAKRFIQKFGDPDLPELLQKSGLGNHPKLVRMLARAGALLKDDEFVGGAPAGKRPLTREEKFYGAKS